MQWQLLHTALASEQSRVSRLQGHALLAMLGWSCCAGHAVLVLHRMSELVRLHMEVTAKLRQKLPLLYCHCTAGKTSDFGRD